MTRNALLYLYTSKGLRTDELTKVEQAVARVHGKAMDVTTLAEAMQYCAEGDALNHLKTRPDPSGHFGRVLALLH